MKKLNKILFTFVFLISLALVTGCSCGKVKIEGLTVSGLKDYAILNETFNLDDLSVLVDYDDDTTKTITDKDLLKISSIDTSVVGEQVLSISFEDFTKEITIKVVGVKDIIMSAEAPKTIVGDSVNFENITAQITFDNDITRTVPSSELTFANLDTTTAGEKTYSVTYKNKTINKTVKVVEISNVEILNLPKIEKGEVLNISDKEIVVTFSDSSTINALASEVVTNLDTSEAGTKNIAITYKNRNFTQEILVYAINKITIVGTIPSIKYGSNGVIDYSKITGLNIDYTDNTSKFLTNFANDQNVELQTSVDATISGNQKISVTYKYYTDNTTNNVIVTEKPVISSIDVNYNSYSNLVKLNDNTFSLNDLTAVVNYLNHDIDTKNITFNDFEVLGNVNTALKGLYEIELKYNEAGFEEYKTFISVKVVGVKSIELIGEYNDEVLITEAYDTSKITGAHIIYGDDALETLTEDVLVNELEFGNIDTSESGTQYLTVKYNKAMAEQKIAIEVIGVKNITLSAEAPKTLVDEKVDFSNITATITYSNNANKVVNFSELTISEIDTSVVGDITYTVTYKDKQIEKTVKVVDIASVKIESLERIEKHEVLNILDKEITVTYTDNSTQTINANEINVTLDTTEIGTKNIAITYKNRNFNQEILVYEIVKLSIVGTIPNINYGSDGLIDYSNVAGIKVEYSDNTDIVLTNFENDQNIQLQQSVDATVSGTHKLTITYKYYTENENISVVVTEKPYVTLNISGYEKLVKLNDEFTLENVSIVVTYHNLELEAKNININDENITLDGSIDTSVAGSQTVTLTYSDKENDIEDYVTSIVVKVLPVTQIELLGEYDKFVKVEENYDISNITGAKITYSDNIDTLREEILASELEIESIDTTNKGTKNLVASYNGKAQNFAVKVVGVSDITLNDAIANVEVDEQLILDNITEITICYEEHFANERLTLNEVMVGDIDTTQSGTKQLAITYKDLTKNFDVLVLGLKALKVNGLIPNMVYQNDTLDISGITGATLTYSNNTTKQLTVEQLNIATPDTSVVGNQQLRISYKTVEDILNYTVMLKVKEIQLLENIQSIEIGEPFVLAKTAQLKIVYEDYSEETLTIADVYCDTNTINTNQVGTQKLEITYKNKTVEIDVVVLGIKTLTINEEIPTEIFRNENLNILGITFTLTYSDNSTKTLTANDVEITGIDTTTVGDKVLTISYREGKIITTHNYKVVLRVVDILLNDTIANVEIGEKVVLDNITEVTIVYEDNSQETLTLNNVVVGEVDTTQSGNKKLTIIYKNYSKEFNVIVLDIDSLTINEEIPTEIYLNDDLDVSSITYTLTYSNGSTKILTISDVEVIGMDTTTAGDKVLTISYKGKKTVTHNYKVVLKVVDIMLNDTIANVEIGEKVVLDNITEVTVVYEDNSQKTLTLNDVIVGEVDTIQSGTKQLTITYRNYSKNFDVVVLGLKSLKINGTIPSDVYQNEDVDLSGITNLTLTYEDDTTRTLNINDSKVSINYNTKVAGNQTLTITYKTVSATLSFNVIGVELDYEILGFEKPETLNQYEVNKNSTSTQASFTIANREYVVGIDNAFILTPEITIFDGENAETIEKTPTNIVLEVSDDNEHFSVVEDTKQYTDRIGVYNVDIDFNENALNKYFRITVTAKNAEDMGSFSHTFKVVEGYNIYDAVGLSVLDNSNPHWNTLKEANNLLNVNTNALVLHNSINITKNDIPTTYFWTEKEVAESGLDQSIVGSLKDRYDIEYSNIYKRVMNPSETFTISGNYFDVDASQIPLCKWNEDGYTSENAITMHAAMFKYESTLSNIGANVIVENIAFIGNSQRSADPVLSGGLILSKSVNVCVDIDNTAFQKWFTGYMFEDLTNYITIDNQNYFLRDYEDEYYTFVKDNTTYYLNKQNNQIYTTSSFTTQVFETNSISITRPFNEVNNTKGFECYNCHIYMWGSQLNIRNSILKSAGGPVLIVDHVNNPTFGSSDTDIKQGINGRPSYVYIYDSELQSLISGAEPWFVTYGATDLVAAMKSLDVYYNDYNQVYQGFVQYVMSAYGCDQATAISMLDQQLAQYNMSMKSTFLQTIDNIPLMNLVAVFKSGSAEGLTTYKVRGEIKVINNNNAHYAMNVGGVHSDTVTSLGQQGFVVENSKNGKVFDTIQGIMEHDQADMSAFSTYYNEPTFINCYIFNGMATMMELYPKK